MKHLTLKDNKTPATNSRFAKAGVSCFYESEVLNSSFVHLIKFSAKNPRLRKAANRNIPSLVRDVPPWRGHLYHLYPFLPDQQSDTDCSGRSAKSRTSFHSLPSATFYEYLSPG